jgi:glycosyltransferase involved in cell wall biosynthesis
VVLGLSEAMRSRYDPVVIVTAWAPPPPGQLWLKLPVPQLPVRHALGFAASFLPNLLRLRTLTRQAIAVNPHFVGLEILPLVLLRVFRLCPKLILSVHGADIAGPLTSSAWKRAVFAWMLSSADLVVACSHALAQTVRRVSPKARVVAVWNAASSPGTISHVRPIDPAYIVCVAGFVKKKGHDTLLAAFRIILHERPQLQLVLIGRDGPEQKTVAAAIHAQDLTGHVHIMVNISHEEVWRWVQHAECLVLPSREEPFGIALLEAALTRTPVVATRVDGVPEFLTDRVHGLLCDPDRPDQIAEAVLHTLTDRGTAGDRVHAFYERARDLTWARAFARYRSKAGLP